MLREERLSGILNQLEKDRRLSTSALMSKYAVTEGTIRRDLNELQSKGLLKKVHGGAISVLTDPVTLSGRLTVSPENKVNLAKKAVKLISNNQLLLIDGGSTNLALIKALPRDISLTIYTNSLPIAMHLLPFPKITTHVIGGKVLKSSEITLDISAYQTLESIKADICFVGIRSIHPDLGIATLDPEEARLKRKILDASDQRVIMATNEKLYTSDRFNIGGMNCIDTVVLEADADPTFIKDLLAKGIDVIQ